MAGFSQLAQYLIQQGQQRRSNTGVLTEIGKNISATRSNFENPWANIATQIASSLVGGAMQGYDQQQVLNERQTTQDSIFKAMQASGGDYDVLRENLSSAGLSDMANTVGFYDIANDMEMEAEFNNPTAQYEREQDAIENDRLGQQLAAQVQHYKTAEAQGWARLEQQREQFKQQQAIKSLLQESSAEASFDKQQAASNKLARELGGDLYKSVTSDPSYKAAAKVFEFTGKLEDVLSNPDSVEQGVLDDVLFTTMRKLASGEAINVDDLQTFKGRLGIEGTSIDSGLRSLRGEGGFSPQVRRSMLEIINATRSSATRNAGDIIKNARERESILEETEGVSISPAYTKFIDVNKPSFRPKGTAFRVKQPKISPTQTTTGGFAKQISDYILGGGR